MDKVRSCCLTIAGGDSGGNAGVEADLRTFHAYGLHGCNIFAALTAQNPFKVNSVFPVPADFVAAQLDAVLGVYSIAALKTGMICGVPVVEAVADRLRMHPQIRKVVDPVMIATSGVRLAGEDAVAAMERLVLPLADIITPNIPEAESISGTSIENVEDMRDAAKRLHGRFGCGVLVKGGHLAGAEVEDVFFDGERFSSFKMSRIENPVSVHGTGCTLSAAIVSELALGRGMRDAIAGAKRYVHNAIATSYHVGPGCGVLGF